MPWACTKQPYIHTPYTPAPPHPHLTCCQVIAESQPGAGGEARPFYDFLESCLRHKSEVVIFEAARAICNMREVTTRELTPAVTVLQLFLSSSKPVLRFAAVRTLNKVQGRWWGVRGGLAGRTEGRSLLGAARWMAAAATFCSCQFSLRDCHRSPHNR